MILDTDASDEAIGAGLSQVQDGREKVIAYASRRLNSAECIYCITRRELLAVVAFVKQFRPHILGRHFVIRTDHAALQWLRRVPEPIGQQARWQEQLEEYDFDIVHRAGGQHGNADAMNRRPCDRTRCCRTVGALSAQVTAADSLSCFLVSADDNSGAAINVDWSAEAVAED